MCSCNSCEGSGWISLRYWHRYGMSYYEQDEEAEPCGCNPNTEPVEEHKDKECVRDVTLGP